MLGIGELDRRILIQVATISRGDLGGATKSWDTHSIGYAKIEFKTAKEEKDNDSLNDVEVVNFYIRSSNLTNTINSYDYRILYPILNATPIDGTTQKYYVNGVQEYDGRLNLLKIITKLRVGSETEA
tara:strand:+ start:2065 stop:2445 length:381 start_codon:yes stop_codon:yes gene_type:complete